MLWTSISTILAEKKTEGVRSAVRWDISQRLMSVFVFS